ncbi:PAS domain S-box protein [Mesorhizobium sp. RP14(2022)]|uniref:histidine kinase n=1 Tax=Mesorhizobium liriopis TaxID=2953882 RepID=A0ABT1CBQ6_9HYPH|nr:ATP-binding protein [Mesorhizobium liriopis]MCO6051616.1 PAS domain S-box protein [Mesorhizobium liriopis]
MVEGISARESGGGLTAATAALARHLRRDSWRTDLGDALGRFGRVLGVHRIVLFRFQETDDHVFIQSIEAIWSNPDVPGAEAKPTEIPQGVVATDPYLQHLSTQSRHGIPFVAMVRDVPGYLGEDLRRQSVKSVLGFPIFANGHLWGSLGLNDCLHERDWTADELGSVELIANIIGEAAERSSSDAHVSEVIRTALIQASLDAVIVIDETGSIIEFNPAAEKMFGFSKQQVLGKDLLHTVVPPFYRKGYATGGEYMSGRGAPMLGRRMETVTSNSDGEIFPIELTASEVRVADRRLMLGSIRDLRPQRAAEDEITRHRERLHQNEKMAAMGSLLAGVSHELNNPLAVVVAQSTLLHEFAGDPQTKLRAEKVRAAAERCGRIVKSFLGMVRLRPPEQSDTDLNTVVRAALEVTAYGARSSGISIDTDLAGERLLVKGDADHLTQVVANFLVNSQHALAGRSGERRIKVRTFRKDSVCGFAVEDSGPGVADAIKDRIFESYFTTKPVGVGTGIGLSISRSIVERHHGTVRLEDAEPHGARFVVELPALAQTAQGAQTPEAPRRELRHALIIDDEPDVASSLADILELMGVKARATATWTSAEDMLREPTDLIFSDLRMPCADGASIFRAVVEKRPDLASRFVLVTGDLLGARAEIDRLPHGMRPLVLEKPFSTLDVRSVLAQAGD